MAAPKDNKPASKPQNPIITTYLVAYNVSQVMGFVFCYILNFYHVKRTSVSQRFGIFE